MTKQSVPVLIALSILVPASPRWAVAQANGFAGRSLRASHVFFSGAVSQPQQGSVSSIASSGPQLIVFDVPGSTYTVATAINALNIITGYYLDANGVHGFVRTPRGAFRTFNVSGALVTIPTAMNEIGVITGFYLQENGSPLRGFVSEPYLGITTFAAPGSFTDTFASAINLEGTVTGNYDEGGDVHHGFLRTRDGALVTFDPPGTIIADDFGPEGTLCAGINLEGSVTGSFEVSFHRSGFVRASDGTFTEFDATGNATHTSPSSINVLGAITGSYNSLADFSYRGFLRHPDGGIELYTVGAGSSLGSVSINALGFIAGDYSDSSLTSHGFLRASDGTVTSFDAPGAGTGFDVNSPLPRGTYVGAINLEGVVVGKVIDNNDISHGFFLRTH